MLFYAILTVYPLQLTGNRTQISGSNTKEESDEINRRTLLTRNSLVVTLRGPSTNYFWDRLEYFDADLEELGVGDEEAENV